MSTIPRITLSSKISEWRTAHRSGPIFRAPISSLQLLERSLRRSVWFAKILFLNHTKLTLCICPSKPFLLIWCLRLKLANEIEIPWLDDIFQKYFGKSIWKIIRKILDRRSTHSAPSEFSERLSAHRSDFWSDAPKIAPLQSGAPELWPFHLFLAIKVLFILYDLKLWRDLKLSQWLAD